MAADNSGGWRYQPVVVTSAGTGEPIFSLCEVYLAEDGTLARWTEEPAMIPQGETIEELSNDLAHMVGDTCKWRPVLFSKLHVGMRFESTGVNVEAVSIRLSGKDNPNRQPR